VQTLLDGPAATVLTTYRRDGSVLVSPVWFRFNDGAFEVVIARGDVKLKHLARRPECTLTVFETLPPFRGVRASGRAELISEDTTAARRAIAGRYLGPEGGRRFAAERATPGVLLRLRDDKPRVWDLSAILPRID
jgi:PPOX class probable F420-dependent enzyme